VYICMGYSKRKKIKDYYDIDCEQITREIKTLSCEPFSMSRSQKASADIAKKYITNAEDSRDLVEFWQNINMARAHRAMYTPDELFLNLVEECKPLNESVLDDIAKNRWNQRIANLADSIKENNMKVYNTDRDKLRRYYEKLGREWNNHNSLRSALRRSLTQILIMFLIGFALYVLIMLITPLRNEQFFSSDSYKPVVASFFGFFGGIFSAMTGIRKADITFRSLKFDIDTLILMRPVVGIIVAIAVYYFLESAISPLKVIASGDQHLYTIAIISFACGLTEKIFLRGIINATNKIL
jgi:hypothetical protein